MNELKKEVKQLAAGGALDVMERVLMKMKENEMSPTFEGSPSKLVYETGKVDGRREVYQSLMNNLNDLANG